MGHVKVDLYEQDRKFDETYDLSSPAGVERFLSSWPTVCAEAAKANFAYVDAIVDIAVSFDDAGLTLGERDVAELVYFDGWDIDEAAVIAGIEADVVRARLATVCEKVANYLEGSEGYRGRR